MLTHKRAPLGYNQEDEDYVYTPCRTVNGKRIWHPKWFSEGKVYRFPKRDKSEALKKSEVQQVQ